LICLGEEMELDDIDDEESSGEEEEIDT